MNTRLRFHFIISNSTCNGSSKYKAFSNNNLRKTATKNEHYGKLQSPLKSLMIRLTKCKIYITKNQKKNSDDIKTLLGIMISCCLVNNFSYTCLYLDCHPKNYTLNYPLDMVSIFCSRR